MSEDLQHLEGQKIRFFGRISASISHELKNVLATINEYSGLLEDIARSGSPPSAERMLAFSEKMAKQVKRGERIIHLMNSFSHSVDSGARPLDIIEAIETLCALCDRFSRLKMITLERRFVTTNIKPVVDPFLLHFVLFLCIEHAMNNEPTHRVVTISLEVGEEQFMVQIDSAEPQKLSDPDPALKALLEQLVKLMDGELSYQAEPRVQRQILTLPLG